MRDLNCCAVSLDSWLVEFKWCCRLLHAQFYNFWAVISHQRLQTWTLEDITTKCSAAFSNITFSSLQLQATLRICLIMIEISLFFSPFFLTLNLLPSLKFALLHQSLCSDSKSWQPLIPGLSPHLHFTLHLAQSQPFPRLIMIFFFLVKTQQFETERELERSESEHKRGKGEIDCRKERYWETGEQGSRKSEKES